jgi:hypothetical protein
MLKKDFEIIPLEKPLKASRGQKSVYFIFLSSNLSQ